MEINKLQEALGQLFYECIGNEKLEKLVKKIKKYSDDSDFSNESLDSSFLKKIENLENLTIKFKKNEDFHTIKKEENKFKYTSSKGHTVSCFNLKEAIELSQSKKDKKVSIQSIEYTDMERIDWIGGD